ncbi:uncharacterized protein PRCAT00004870001 [Priceomyces carsonii]|uniref:uncharacterized protein n=1 Tax=Priceomyces carsonii TaxID=28549 RepID=UPI002EDAF59D|nr:unnamed protein product [Priceomyces carsonii]
MPSYSDLFAYDNADDILPPLDTLSEAMYNQTKIGYAYSNTGMVSNDNDDSNVLSGPIPRENSSGNALYGQEKDEGTQAGPFADWKLMRVMAGAHQGWVRCVSVDPVTNKWFATGSSDSTIKIWDLASLTLKAQITGHIMGIRSLAISTKFPYLFSGSEDKTVRCWDLERTNSSAGCQLREYHGHVGGIYAMALHPELDLLFTGGRDQVIRVWDIRTRTEVMVLTGHRSDISSIISQIGDPQVISSSMDSTIRLWDLRKQETALTLTHHSKSIRLLVEHPTEMTMCSGDSSGNIKEWLLPGGQLLNTYGEEDGSNIINTLAINPSNNTLFSGFDDGRMKFYDYVSGDLKQSTKSIPVPGSSESSIYASSFDMLGMRLILCEEDKSIKIWGES